MKNQILAATVLGMLATSASAQPWNRAQATPFLVAERDALGCWLLPTGEIEMWEASARALNQIRTPGRDGESIGRRWKLRFDHLGVIKNANRKGGDQHNLSAHLERCRWEAEAAPETEPRLLTPEVCWPVVADNLKTPRAGWLAGLGGWLWSKAQPTVSACLAGCRENVSSRRSDPAAASPADVSLSGAYVLLTAHESAERLSSGGAGHHGQSLNFAIQIIEQLLGMEDR